MTKTTRAALVLGLFLVLGAFLAWGAMQFAAQAGGRGMSFVFAILALGSALAGLGWAKRQLSTEPRS